MVVINPFEGKKRQPLAAMYKKNREVLRTFRPHYIRFMGGDYLYSVFSGLISL